MGSAPQSQPVTSTAGSGRPLVGIIMGSASDWETMQHAAQTLDSLGIAYEKRVISAHRTPKLMYEWGGSARDRGLKVVIAGAGGAAHLAGVAAALTPLPVLGVPMESASLKGLDSLLSMVQMPGGIPVATFAIGKPGAINAALFAAAILALGDAGTRRALDAFRAEQARKVEESRLP
jgi:5-(carboxyamino)imidazole ribonucleotide mutase